MTEGKRHPATVSLGFGIVSKPKLSRPRGDDKPPSTPALKPRVLIVDDDAGMRRMLAARLEPGHLVTCVANSGEALDACVLSRPHLIITELRMAPMDGLALLKELKSRWPEISVIILTAHGTIPDAVKATQAGAFGFLVKPVERDELMGQVQRAIAASNFSPDAADWRANLDARAKLMEERLGRANNAAVVNSPVLLTGQNGAGKELLARAIHAASPRRDGPFVTVECQGADEVHLEAILFGGVDPESGESIVGAIQKAQHGTLLLDHLDELPLRLQARLVIEVKDADSLKGLEREKADVRLICTTDGNLKAAMDKGLVRDDLYYLVSVMPIEAPPLGRRREDLPLLVSHFLEQATDAGNNKLYTPEAIEHLATTDWPAEVRHLFDLVKKGVTLAQDPVTMQPSAVPSLEEARDQFTRDYLVNHMQRTNGNITEAARLAKRNRTDFYKLLARFQVNAGDFKPPESRYTDQRRGERNRRASDRR
jgi:two-component system response regulator GlrR